MDAAAGERATTGERGATICGSREGVGAGAGEALEATGAAVGGAAKRVDALSGAAGFAGAGAGEVGGASRCNDDGAVVKIWARATSTAASVKLVAAAAMAHRAPDFSKRCTSCHLRR